MTASGVTSETAAERKRAAHFQQAVLPGFTSPTSREQSGHLMPNPASSSVSSLREAPGLLSCAAPSYPVCNRRTTRKAGGREQGEAAYSQCRAGKVLVLMGSSRKPESSSAQGWSEPEVPQAEEAAQGLGKPALEKLWQK